MADMQAVINHYAREGYARSIQQICDKVLAKRPGEPVASFWRAFGTIKEGAYNEALRELDALSGEREVELATRAAMIHAHQLCKIVDHEAVDALESRVRELEDEAPERALLQCATFHWLVGGPEGARNARAYAERVTAVQPDLPAAQTLLAWVDLTVEEPDEGQAERQRRVQGCSAAFERVIASAGPEGKDTLEALMGRAKCQELSGQLDAAVETLNRLSVSHAWYTAPLCERARLHMIQGDWEQLLETTQRVLQQEPQNVQALRLSTLYLLSREGRVKAACEQLGELTAALQAGEPRNAGLYYGVARPLGRLAAGNKEVLGKLQELVVMALKLAPENVEFLNEYAYQQQQLGQFAEAVATYRKAAAIDEADGTLDDLSSLYGTIQCQIADGQLKEAEQQLDFLNEIATERSPKLSYLTALLAWRARKDGQAASKALDGAVDVHLKAMRGRAFGYDYFVALDPDLLLDCARLYLEMSPGEPRGPAEPLSPQVQRATRVLDTLVRKTPGLLEAQVLLTRARYLAGDLEGAARAGGAVVRLDPTLSEVHILLAQVHLAGQQYRAAEQALEQALSFAFEVREWPQYSIVRAHVLLERGEAEEALKMLEGAMAQPGVAKLAPRGVKQKHRVTLSERASVYLLLAQAHNKLGHVPEATKTIQDASSEFMGTPEEVRINVASCELALARGDVASALSQLNSVPPSSPHYMRAKVALADIHLSHRGDRESYKRCYEELVERQPDVTTFTMQGEALMAIQEPEEAVGAFERALAQNPADVALASKIGRALVITHDFQKAVDYYEAAVRKDPTKLALQRELARLYTKLRRFDLAKRVLSTTLHKREGHVEDVHSLADDVESMRLLAQLHLGAGDGAKYSQALQATKQAQAALLSRCRSDPEEYNTQQLAAAELCFEVAEDLVKTRSYDQAAANYQEALKYDEHHIKSMTALARLMLLRGDADACQNNCVALLRVDPENEEATLMLAEIMFHKEHYETAIYHFQQLLERRPGQYVALSHLVTLLRLAGRLGEVPKFLRNAELSSPRAAHEPGLHFCKGLHAKYNNAPRDALQHFNLARKDSEWGQSAIYEMVGLYLNPEHEAMWEESGESKGADNSEALRAAGKLLSEVRGRRGAKHAVLEAYTKMASKNRAAVDEAVSSLMQVCQDDMENVPALLCMATGLMMQKQVPKARNQLKRIAKMTYNIAEAEEFERAWLMLADIHIQGGKFDLAQEVCKKCLKYNKSCSKAWEYMGQIMEREQSYRDAAEHYENAWRYEAEATPAVGYRLAFNYLKAKRYVDAIDVCHKVLAVDPNFPKIHKDILDKARQLLKP